MSRINDSPDVHQVDRERTRSLDPSLTEGDCTPVRSIPIKDQAATSSRSHFPHNTATTSSTVMLAFGARWRFNCVPNSTRSEGYRADMVMKSRAHQASKNVHGPCTVFGKSFAPFAGDAIPLGVGGL